MPYLKKLLCLRLTIEVIFWCLHGPARVMECSNAFRARANYREHMLKGVMMLPMEWHVDHHSGDTIDKVEKGASAIYRFSGNSFQVIYGFVQLAVAYLMLAYLSPPSSLIVMVMLVATIFITMKFDRVLLKQYKELNHNENNVYESMFDAISNISTVIILRVERLIHRTIIQKAWEKFDLFKNNNILNEIKWFLTSICCIVMMVAVLGEFFWHHSGDDQAVALGIIYLLMDYLGKINNLFFKFTDMYGDILVQKSRLANAEELEKDFNFKNFTNHVLPGNWKRLDIRDVNFSYGVGDNSELNLINVSLSLRRGERIAFIGESGSGKTTMLKVMRDLYHPGSLQLLVDGNLIADGFEGICQAMALVPQNPEIFATTILENITMGAEYGIDFVRYFTDMSCFTEVADGLPKKFNSSIKEKGVNLSGGQQQRLALARGLLACHDKDIVLLDEPTSSLDTITEMNVYKNIFREFKNKTIISSVHRLHLLPLFDRICLFDEGQITAIGNFEEMIKNCPKFQSLWNMYKEIGDNIQA